MNTSDNKSNKWSEADIDRLLTGFFAQEMPAEFRLRTQSIGLTRPQSDRPGRMVWTGLAATAAAMLMAVIVARSTVSESAPGKSIANKALVPTDPAVPVTDRIETDEGIVELKTWLVEEQDSDLGLDLRGLHIDIEYDLKPDDDDSDSATNRDADSPTVPEED
jgi:hypothetical protein